MIVSEPILTVSTLRPWNDASARNEDVAQLCTSGAGRRSNPPGGRRTLIAAAFDENNEDDAADWRDWTLETEP
jgi:hypothetical protein